jgi:archaellum component FlaC
MEGKMNEKARNIALVICIALLTALLSGTISFFAGQNRGVATGAGEYRERAESIDREYKELQRLGEEGNRREAERLRSAGSRVEQVDRELEALRSLSPRSSQLLENIRAEVGILQRGYDYFRSDYYSRRDSFAGSDTVNEKETH